jgi:tripartite-type tricarboxylate transporter receptor subunit TctC
MFRKLSKKLLFVMVALLVGFMTACGNSETTSESGNEGSKSESSGYPEKPVTIYVNYSAGGNTDLSYRALAKTAEKHLGQPIVIKNVTGGGGAIGVAELAKAKADGYTLGNTSLAPLTVLPHRQEVTYDPKTDFTYIGGWGKQLYGIVVSKDSPYETFEDFIAAAKENPGMTFSDPAPGGLNTLGAQLLDRAEGNVPGFKSVPYQGGGEATAAVLGNQVDFTVNNPAPLISGLESGDLRLLVSLSDSKWEALPDVPTIRDLGYDYDLTSWFGLGGPTGLPDEVVKVWEEVLQKTLEDPEFIETMKKMDTPLQYLPGDEYQELVNESYDTFKAIIEEE